MPKKTERGTLWDFSTSILSQNFKKNAGGTLWGEFFFRKKSLAVPKKNERGESLVSPGMVCYAEKQEKPFWFSSLGQIVQFGAIIFRRTFKNYFGQFVWIEKKSHYNSRVSLHEAPTKNDVFSNYVEKSWMEVDIENAKCLLRNNGSLSLCPPYIICYTMSPPREKECLWLIYIHLLLANLSCYSVNQLMSS